MELELRDRELVAFVGAGGKSTTMLTLAARLVKEGRAVVVTSTTHVRPDQVDAARAAGAAVLFAESAPHKTSGVPPDEVDAAFADSDVDYVLCEADGARRMLIKAPADHEPVIPSATTLVVAIANRAAIGRPVAEVAHRPELVSAVTGLGLDEPVTEDSIQVLLSSPSGGAKGVPSGARFVPLVLG